MNRIDTTFETLKQDVAAFYQPQKHHFIAMNGTDLGNEIEYQWFFCDYEYPCAITAFYAKSTPDTVVPTLRHIVEPAWVAEAELVDLLDINIEETEKGFVLEPDSMPGPLRKKK